MDTASLIFKVLAGEGSETERDQLDQWIGASEANRVEFEDLKLLWLTKGAEEQSVTDFHLGLRKIKKKIGEKIVRKKRLTSRLWFMVLVLGLIANIFVIYVHTDAVRKPEFLEFDDVPLEKVISTLKQEYDIIIEVENDMLWSCRFTGAFINVDNGQEILFSLTSALNLECQRQSDNTYILSGKPCHIIK